MYYRLFHGCTGRAVNGDLIDVTDSKEEALAKARELALDVYSYVFGNNGPSYADCAQILLSEKGQDLFALCEQFGISFKDIERRYNEDIEPFLIYYVEEVTEEEFMKYI